MAVPTQIRIVETDYDQILQNLVEFMKADPTFADYDFAGSGLRLLARVLAYVTFYNNYYLTAAVNESFLDTAQLRSSVASHTRMLGYDIKGTQSARLVTNVAVSLANTQPATTTLPKLTQFSLSANGAFTFYTLSDITLTRNLTTNLYEAANVEIVEGKPLTYRFTVDLSNPLQKFVIPNANIDYTTISVRVQASAGSNSATNYSKATNYLTIANTDPVFFVQESYNGFPELKFGNGVVGKALENGNIIIADYLVSRGEAANNLRGPFTVASANVDSFLSGTTTVDANTASTGGSDFESLDNARFLAPLTYQAQNRCVTTEDYKAAILAEYGSQIAAINVFGGEQGNPNDPQERPIYGRVFIALKPKIGLRFTDITRKAIETNVIRPRSIVGVIPEVIDPDYIYIVVSTSVRYDTRDTTRTSLQLETAIKNSVSEFAQSSVEKFDTAFRFSKLVRAIDRTDDAIVSSMTRLDLEKRIYPVLGASNQFVLKFNAPVRQNGGSVILENTSYRFDYKDDSGTTYANCFFVEESGAVHVSRRSGNTVFTVKSNIGTLNLDTGLLILTNFQPEAIEGDEIFTRIRITPAVNDFVPRLNQLFTLDAVDINVQLLNDATATLADQTAFFTSILP